jgi:uncharacterized protein
MSYTSQSLEHMKSKATANFTATKRIPRKLEHLQPWKLDKLMENFHDEEFEKIDCLECANCCRSISPAMKDSDIRRMASELRINEAELIQRFLLVDEDGDYVFRSSPCPFLEKDNRCSIYDVRPRACREYPHTDRKRFYQILDLTTRNSKVCPAVFNIFEKLKRNLPA